MGRTAYSETDKSSSSDQEGVKADTYAEQILKYIPAEVVAFYLPALAIAAELNPEIVNSNGETGVPSVIPLEYSVTIWVIFIVGLLGTFLYMRRSAINDLQSQKVDYYRQRALVKAGIATFAFFLWAIFLGGPWAIIPSYQTFGTLLILGFTLLNPVLYEAIAFPITLGSKQVTVNVKYNPTVGDVPGKIVQVTIKNHTSENLNVAALDLFSGSSIVISESNTTIIEAKKTVTITPSKLMFNPKVDNHYLKVKFLNANYQQSGSISTQQQPT